MILFGGQTISSLYSNYRQNPDFFRYDSVATGSSSFISAATVFCQIIASDPIFLFSDSYKPPKLNSSPLKNGGWKTSLSYWVSVTCPGRTVKLREGICQLSKVERALCVSTAATKVT